MIDATEACGGGRERRPGSIGRGSARRRGRVWPGLSAAAAALLSAGCVSHPIGPARTFDAYEGKATTTAESARSAVQTVRLLAEVSSRGNAFGTYVGVAVSEQEDALDGLAGTFRSIQPPDGEADALRRQLDAMLGRALDHVVDVRVAVRRGELRDLDEVARPLEADADALDAFIEDHS